MAFCVIDPGNHVAIEEVQKEKREISQITLEIASKTEGPEREVTPGEQCDFLASMFLSLFHLSIQVYGLAVAKHEGLAVAVSLNGP